MSKTYRRHIAKSLTWRIVGTIDTILLSWWISGNPYTGLKIGSAEFITKMILYFLHERLWFKIRIGITKNGDSRKRHIAKTISWRFVGTLDTMTLGWIISGDPMTGLQIGLAEVCTKMLLYYFHERAWYNIDYGLEERRSRGHKRKKEFDPVTKDD
ncbi:MAG: DUF2061 domain-containing protein [Salinimicrobium sp.]